MELCENIFCRLCHNTISDNNFTVIEEAITKILNVLLLKLDIKDFTFSVICNACYAKVFEAFQFKITCMHTEDIIFPYLDSETGAPIDLREVYLKERNKKHYTNITEEERVCRLCMQIYAHGFTLIIDLDSDLIHKYIPEMNFSSTKESVVCSACLDSLKIHRRFLKDCLNVQGITNISVDKEDPIFIKPEEIDIKCEVDEVGCAPDFVEKLCEGETSQRHQLIQNLPVHHQPLPKDSSEVILHKCDTCKYETKHKHLLRQHQLIHKDRSQIQLHKCDICNFETKRKYSLTLHLLLHKDISEVQMYKCDTCNFQTKHKRSLYCHQIIHKNISETQTYKCDKCVYKTNRKHNLTQHQLLHKDISEVQMYKCDICNFETKYKSNLVNHQLVHQDVSQARMYKCDTCSIQFKNKSHLKHHRLQHEDISKVQMYKCDKCNYKTNHKHNITQHQLIHIHFRDTEVHV